MAKFGSPEFIFDLRHGKVPELSDHRFRLVIFDMNTLYAQFREEGKLFTGEFAEYFYHPGSDYKYPTNRFTRRRVYNDDRILIGAEFSYPINHTSRSRVIVQIGENQAEGALPDKEVRHAANLDTVTVKVVSPFCGDERAFAQYDSASPLPSLGMMVPESYFWSLANTRQQMLALTRSQTGTSETWSATYGVQPVGKNQGGVVLPVKPGESFDVPIMVYDETPKVVVYDRAGMLKMEQKNPGTYKTAFFDITKKLDVDQVKRLITGSWMDSLKIRELIKADYYIWCGTPQHLFRLPASNTSQKQLSA